MQEVAEAVVEPAMPSAPRELDAELQPIYEAISVTTNPIPVKTALEMLGICSARDAAADGSARASGQRDVVRAALEAPRARGRRMSGPNGCGSCRSAGSARSART